MVGSVWVCVCVFVWVWVCVCGVSCGGREPQVYVVGGGSV